MSCDGTKTLLNDFTLKAEDTGQVGWYYLDQFCQSNTSLLFNFVIIERYYA